MVLDQPLLGPAPEALHPVDADLSGGEILAVVHLQVPVAAEHQAIVAVEPIGVNDASPADLLDGEAQQGLRPDIRDDVDLDDALPLQDPEDGNLAGSTAPSFPLPSASEVGLIQLDLTAQENIGIVGMAQDGHPDRHHGPVNGPIGQLHLLGHLPDGNFQFKELEDRQPLHAGQTTMVDPTTGELMIRVLALRATVSSILQFVLFSMLTTGAKSVSIFQAFF